MIMSDGYATRYSQEKVREKAKFAARAIKELMARTNADSVVVHGNSGVSCGFAALMYADFPLVLLRKDNDNSHGAPIEGPEGHEMRRYIVLDDFTATGATLNRVRGKIKLLYEQLDMNEYPEPPECVGVVFYGYHHADGFKFSDGLRVPVISK